MEKLLIIEDDEHKIERLKTFAQKHLPEKEVFLATSLVTAIENINKYEFSLIFVDMGIPSHPIEAGSGSPVSLLTGGIEVLLELSELQRTDPCIIITQYPDIEISGQFYPLSQATQQLYDKLECKVETCVHYIEDSSEWEEELKKAIQKI